MQQALLVVIAILFAMTSFSQETETKSDSLRKDALRVYYQDADDYVKREIPFVNYVRDIKDAGVYIIRTYQQTGSGGTEYTYFLTGQNEFEGMIDTVSCVTTFDDTSDEVRQKRVDCLKIGLMRYIAKTPLSQYIKISFTEPMSESISTDKWNNWVFRLRANVYLDGQETRNSREFYGTFSSEHITEDWKVELSANYSNEIANLKSLSITNRYKSSGLNTRIVKSISEHWSYGGSVGIRSSIYNNYNSLIEFMPGIEYDLFPYSESTRRQLRILYQIGYNNANYIDSTIYDKSREDLYLHSLMAAYQVIQKWGDINMSLRYRNYLHDWSLNNIYFSSDISFRITKGLRVNWYGYYSINHDQMNIRKGALSPEDILLRRKQEKTAYNYYLMFGFTYTFGSIYNNVVNPRFGN